MDNVATYTHNGTGVRRQLTIEERELMLQGGPASHPAAVFDETAIEVRVVLERGFAAKMPSEQVCLFAPAKMHFYCEMQAPVAEEGGERSPEAMAAAAAAAGVERASLCMRGAPRIKMLLLANQQSIDARTAASDHICSQVIQEVLQDSPQRRPLR